ncbi:MAG: TRL-like family protein [Bacteroidales bacterium]|jgi:hypothetical protein|nr:TRL-like family protein [Bacteroidales bacterium]
MKKNSLSLLLLLGGFLFATLFLQSCTITTPISATSHPVGNKIGEASQMGILFFPPFTGQPAGVLQAAKNGGITKISTVDYSVNYFILFTKRTTTVTGE